MEAILLNMGAILMREILQRADFDQVPKLDPILKIKILAWDMHENVAGLKNVRL